jgi:hypothetical protein
MHDTVTSIATRNLFWHGADYAHVAEIVATGILIASLSNAQAEATLRAVMHSDVKIVEPIRTSAYITRNHGYMIYDTRCSRWMRMATSSRK